MITCDVNHIYRNDEGEIYLSVTQQLIIAGLVDYSMVRREDLDFAALRGQYVHEASNMYLHDDLDLELIDDSYRGYVEGFVKFVTENGLTVWRSEELVWDEKLRTAGRFDFIGTLRPLNSLPILFEIKTTASISPTVKLQTAAYKLFYERRDSSVTPTQRSCLHLMKNGNYKLIKYIDRNDGHAFCNIVRGNWWALNNGIIPIGAKSDPKIWELCKTIINGG